MNEYEPALVSHARKHGRSYTWFACSPWWIRIPPWWHWTATLSAAIGIDRTVSRVATTGVLVDWPPNRAHYAAEKL